MIHRNLFSNNYPVFQERLTAQEAMLHDYFRPVVEAANRNGGDPGDGSGASNSASSQSSDAKIEIGA